MTQGLGNKIFIQESEVREGNIIGYPTTQQPTGGIGIQSFNPNPTRPKDKNQNGTNQPTQEDAKIQTVKE